MNLGSVARISYTWKYSCKLRNEATSGGRFRMKVSAAVDESLTVRRTAVLME
jgi:hypothetical protein